MWSSVDLSTLLSARQIHPDLCALLAQAELEAGWADSPQTRDQLRQALERDAFLGLFAPTHWASACQALAATGTAEQPPAGGFIVYPVIQAAVHNQQRLRPVLIDFARVQAMGVAARFPRRMQACLKAFAELVGLGERGETQRQQARSMALRHDLRMLEVDALLFDYPNRVRAEASSHEAAAPVSPMSNDWATEEVALPLPARSRA